MNRIYEPLRKKKFVDNIFVRAISSLGVNL